MANLKPMMKPVNRRPDAARQSSVLSGHYRQLLHPQILRGCFLLWLAVSVVAVCLSGRHCLADEPALEREFTLKVLPLLKSRCFGCHGDDPKDVRGEYDVRSREALLRGGESGEPSIVPGNPEASPLYQAVRWDGLEMPPKESDRLSPDEIQMLHRWIKAGAPWPDEKRQRQIREQERRHLQTADGVLVRTSGGQSEEWTDRRYQPDDLWAFRSLQTVSIPEGQHPVDHLVRKRLAESKVSAAATADPRTLIRRATFDLTGLPPTPHEVSQFLQAWNRDADRAWVTLIDRLLDSPHYGERWAQHWLDVARYADTGGYSNDYERSNMWRYRDYVIRSLNKDKPYNQFIIEQLAGDELWEEQPASQRDPELLVAVGFLRLGPWDPAMVKKPEARQIFLDDVVNAVGQTFLSTTMRCVKCHDHKFDPIPTRDYYRMYAAFAGTQMAERPAPFLAEENQNRFQEGRASVQRLLDFARSKKDTLYDKQELAARAWYRERGQPYVDLENRKQLPDDEKPPRHVGLDDVDKGRLKVREQDEWIWNRRLERYEPLAQSVYNGPDPNYLNARKLRMPARPNLSWRPDSRVLAGGSLAAPGEVVEPGVLSALGLPVNETSGDPFVIDGGLAGRRLALARWIAHPDNPLTSRSIVNRIWQYHFAQPLAGNPNNFGAKGAKPTHPELLDWLAADFVAGGWTFKRLHRLIMTSDTYRQSTRHPQLEEIRQLDTDNHLLAYFPTRRLTAEELRDAMLAVSGELNPEVGGVPAMPEINLEVALQPRMIQFSLAPAYQPSRTPQERNRRSIYAYRVRGQADPFMEVFHQPNPNDSCELRDDAAVSPQAFTLMNSELMSDRSIAFALRLQREADTVRAQIQRAFKLAFGRDAAADELRQLTAYVERMQNVHRQVEPVPASYPTRVTRSLVEEFSGQPFDYEEILPVFENYVRDRKPADVSPKTRALADLCLLLFNSNEFLHVD